MLLMLSKSALATVLKDQLKELEGIGRTVPRTAFPASLEYDGASALVVKGVRRCGKSTLMMQIIDSRFKDDFLYVNFDDERLSGFKTEDFQHLMEAAEETFGKTGNLFFDEIQNISGWELFVNRMLRQGCRVFITGSNANLLSMELGSHMTGRHIDVELFPFSFREYLLAKGVPLPEGNAYSTHERAVISTHFKDYLMNGGMPEAVISSNMAVLAQLINDILQRDIVVRHGIRKPAQLKSVVKFMVANAGNSITYRSVVENFSLKSPNTVQKYIEYAQETYLVFKVNRFEERLRRLEKNPKKIYCIDNGIVAYHMPDHMEKNGALLENLVAIHLRRQGDDFYYYRGKTNREADFIAPKHKLALQVCYNLTEKNRLREIQGLHEAMERIGIQDGLILTLEQEQDIDYAGRKIRVMPAWEWLLQTEKQSIRSIKRQKQSDADS